MHHRDRDTPLRRKHRGDARHRRQRQGVLLGFLQLLRLGDRRDHPALRRDRHAAAGDRAAHVQSRHAQAENDYLPACAHYGIGVAPFSPLARGALTGKYKQGAEPPNGSRAARGDNSLLTRDLSRRSFDAVEAIRAMPRSAA
jgi:hypothetical protein